MRKGRGGSVPACHVTKAAIAALWLLAVAVRLVLINQPYVDYWSWRQSDVAAIARNFFECGFRFGYPQIDWAGGSDGYVGTEFPILSFLAAICYKFAGIHEWIGRSQSVIFFAISLPFFVFLVCEIFGSTAAIWATFFYAFAPLSVFAGRSFMPDVPSLSLAIIGLYFFLRWVPHGNLLSLLLAAITISLSLLIKITSIVIAAPLLYVALKSRDDERVGGAPRTARRLQLAAFAAIAVLPSVAWYSHAYQISERFYPHHFFGAGGIRLESFSWYWEIARQTVTSSLTPALAIMALIGLFVAPRGRFGYLFDWWLAAMVLFVVAVGYGNRHPWYQLPLVPIAAAFASAGCAFFESKISSGVVAVTLSTLLASLFAILAFLYARPLFESSATQLRNAGLELNKITSRNALIVALDGGNPTIFYYAKRKGWHFLEKGGIYDGNPTDSQQAIADLERLRRQGATHFVFTTTRFWWLDSYPEFTQHLSETATLLEATPEFKIYKLRLE
ncbi:MAG TPA: glycosyltransferase family 39 protein [Candidatus Udaeobacter sp.]|nr:glycosyltransferase family 39 protein [Candidatus Udaeobacter sp.]